MKVKTTETCLRRWKKPPIVGTFTSTNYETGSTSWPGLSSKEEPDVNSIAGVYEVDRPESCDERQAWSKFLTNSFKQDGHRQAGPVQVKPVKKRFLPPHHSCLSTNQILTSGTAICHYLHANKAICLVGKYCGTTLELRRRDPPVTVCRQHAIPGISELCA
jgi:hypothetical protein